MDKITFEDKIALNEQPSIDVKNKVTADDMNQIKNVVNSIIEGGLETAIANAIKEENKKRYYVGSLIFDTKNINPVTYLGFGTWQLWGSGCVPVGVDTSQLEFNTVEKTGGGKNITLTSANLPSHIHSIAKHTHTIPNHTHTGPSHSHTTPNHTHTWSGTTSWGGGHTHSVLGYPLTGGGSYRLTGGVSGASNGLDGTTGNNILLGAAAYSGDHNHTISGTTSSNNGGSTGTSGTGLTGGWSGNTGEGGSTATGSTGSGTAVSVLQPYITCYIWKRTA